MKKSFRTNLLELCKTGTKKSSPDLFNFMYSRLVMTWPMTLAGLPREGAVSKGPWLQSERTKNEGPSEKMSFSGETVWRFQRKKLRNFHSSHGEKNKRTSRPQGQKLTMNHVARQKLTKQKWKNHSEQICWNSARLELRSQVLTCSTLCNVGWSWHSQWQWRGYHVQAQFQSLMITNRTYKKRRAFWKNEL